MMYALDLTQERVEPKPGGCATCECCGAPVVAKCGEINIWHWAHKSGQSCTDYHEPESMWHRRWKECAPANCREVVRDKHRADLLVSGVAIEFQHSHIKPEAIRKREAHWGRLIWVVDGVMAYERQQNKPSETVGILVEEKIGGGAKLVWFHGKKWVKECEKRVFIDLGGSGVDGLLFEVQRWWNTGTLIADGRLVSHNRFIDTHLKPSAPYAIKRPNETAGLPLFGGQ